MLSNAQRRPFSRDYNGQPDRDAGQITGRQSVGSHEPGETLTPRMLKAAGSEYRRAHHFKYQEFGRGWSHGDASMTNVIYDEKADRARLIDFEIRHERRLPAAARHADDLLVFLLDMVGRVPNRQWLRSRSVFCAPTDDARRHPRIEKTSRRSDRPGRDAVEMCGPILPERKSKAAFSSVAPRPRQAGSLSARLRSIPTRKRRRPSISCQRMRPGMPTIKSRKRASKDMAKAVSPGMPRRLPMTR